MSKEIFKIIFEEFKKNGIKLNDFEYRGDTFVGDPLDIVNAPILRGEDEDIRPLLDFSEHDKPFENEIKLLKERIEKMESEKKFLRMRCMEDAIDAFDRGSYGALTIVGRRGALEAENKMLKQRIAELESEKSEKPVAYVLAKEIDGQHYVTVEDFMSVVNNLQSKAEGV